MAREPDASLSDAEEVAPTTAISADTDNPEWTTAELAAARPAAKALPAEVIAAFGSRHGQRGEPPDEV